MWSWRSRRRPPCYINTAGAAVLSVPSYPAANGSPSWVVTAAGEEDEGRSSDSSSQITERRRGFAGGRS